MALFGSFGITTIIGIILKNKKMDFQNNKLLQDFMGYAIQSEAKFKVLRIYRKCLKYGKIEIANKIKRKYFKIFPADDLTDATLLALSARQITRNN